MRPRSKKGVVLVPLSAALLLMGCGAGFHDDTADVQRAVDAGGSVTFPAGTYILKQTIIVRKSNTIIQGIGPETVFVFEPTLPQVHCVNDRAFTTPCDVITTPRRQILGPIAIGDESFVSAGDVSDLHTDDWLIIEDLDRKAGDVVVVDWAQVGAVFGSTVGVQVPFRTAFPNVREWDPKLSGLGYYKIPQLVEGVQLRNLKIIVPDSGQNAPGISVFAALNTQIDSVTVQNSHGQPLYSYLAKNLTIQNSNGIGEQVLNEFGATVDLRLNDNSFSTDRSAGLGLDFGTGFFQVTRNVVPSSSNIGAYLLFGVHDGSIQDNSISFVGTSGATGDSGVVVGLLARGTQRVVITNNFLAGGAGPTSIGISIGPAYGLDTLTPSLGNTVSPNTFGPLWGVDYDPSNAP
jgi:hypothetical protein